MVKVLLSIFFLNNLFGASQDPTYLVFNHFDKEIPDAEKLLIENFNDSKFEFDASIKDIFSDLDSYDNPASSHMEMIKDLGEQYKVNFILLNKIEHKEDRFILDGLLFNTRSGGLIHRRKINLKHYLNGQINELVMWVGKTLGVQQQEWQENRESILFSDPESISYEKTPMGAAIRSLIAPGWGQAYSDKKVSAGVWFGVEASLSLAFVLSYLNYDKSAKGFLSNSVLYNDTDDEKLVAKYRSLAETDWDNHIIYSRLAIALASATGTGWVSNSIHAWIFGPRPYTNIYQEWDNSSKSNKG